MHTVVLVLLTRSIALIDSDPIYSKERGRYDLPIALGILAASGQIPKDALDSYEVAGELALTGELRPIRGALAMAYHMAQHTSQQSAFILPKQSVEEASLVQYATIYPVISLKRCNIDGVSVNAVTLHDKMMHYSF